MAPDQSVSDTQHPSRQGSPLPPYPHTPHPYPSPPLTEVAISVSKRYDDYMARATIAALTAVTLLVAAIWAFSTGQARVSRFECDGTTTVIAQPLDSLWSIAAAHCGGAIDHAVSHMVEDNDGARIVIGQTIHLPESHHHG